MNSRKLTMGAIAAICAFSIAGEACARGGMGGGRGMGIRARQRDGSCIRNSIASQTQTQTRQQLRAGSAVNTGVSRQSAGQGQRRQFGPGDGTGNATRPLDGTGYGSPSKIR